jgi:hypothetical protein
MINALTRAISYAPLLSVATTLATLAGGDGPHVMGIDDHSPPRKARMSWMSRTDSAT